MKVVVEMADAYNVFSRCLYFNPEMSDKHKDNIKWYTKYYTEIIHHIDIYLQEDQLMHTRLGFPLVPVPTYFLHRYDLEQTDVRHIEDSAFAETR